MSQSQFNYGSLLWEIDRRFENRTEFCKKVGISGPTLWRYLKGTSPMPSDFIAKACEVLSIPKEEIGFYFFNPCVDKSKHDEDNETGKCSETVTV